ncbi:histidine kinase [Vibrio tubiashii]|nr:histidine kinase [Vibrio tubiashii]
MSSSSPQTRGKPGHAFSIIIGIMCVSLMFIIGYVFYSQSEIKNVSPQPYVTIVNNNLSAKGKLLSVKNELLVFVANPSNRTLAKLKIKARVQRSSILQDFQAERTQRIHQQYGDLKKLSKIVFDIEGVFLRLNSVSIDSDSLTANVLKELDAVYGDLNLYLSNFVSNVQKNQMQFAQFKEDFYDRQSLYLGLILLISMIMIGAISWMYVNQIKLAHDLKERTDNMEAAKKLAEESAMAKARFLANMSHEMRTPLNSVIGLSQKEYYVDCDDQTRQFTSLINSSGQHLLKLINSVLDISKIEQGKVKLERDTFYCEELVDVSKTIFIEMSKPDVEVYFSTSLDKNYQIVADKTKLLQIVNNLSYNAVKFTAHGFVDIHFDIDIETSMLSIKVQDTGIGMNEEQLSKVFEEFTQADDSITRKYGGTGLGLSISQSLVQLMGGTLSVQSKMKLGTTFMVSVPVEIVGQQSFELPSSLTEQVSVLAENAFVRNVIVDELSRLNLYAPSKGSVLVYVHNEHDKVNLKQLVQSQPGISHVIAYTGVGVDLPNLDNLTKLSKPYDFYHLLNTLCSLFAPESNLGKDEIDNSMPSLSVLIVEDMKVNQIVASKMLSTLNVRSEVANDGQECLEILAEKTFDLIFMDIQMPVMDGIEAMKRIREDNLAPGTAIIALTANTFEKDVLSYLEQGFNDVLPKPVRLDLMQKTIEKYQRSETPPV